MPTISIIIPVYNVEKYLLDCLDSVRAQTFTDWECICVDDGSTDNSSAILDEYTTKDSRFRIIHNNHSNAGACRNAGMDIAKGEFLSFLDSDDIFAPKMLEFLLCLAKKHDAEVVSCLHTTYKDGDMTPRLSTYFQKSSIEIFINPSIKEDIYSKWVGWAWDKLFKRSFIEKNKLRFQEIRSTNDMRFTFSALSFAKTVINIKCSLIAHRKNISSLESTRSKDPTCMIEALKSYYNNMHSSGVFKQSPLLEHYYKLWIVKFMLWHMDTIDTVDAYKVVHEAFFDICRYFELYKLSEDDFSNFPERYKRFKSIMLGCSPLESSRLHEVMLMKELVELQSIKYYANSKDYKIGRTILFLPRTLTRLMKTCFNVCSFF